MSKNKVKDTTPSWLQLGEAPRSNEVSPWYTDSECFWRWRAIHHPQGLDYVWDRGGFVEGQRTADRAAFIKAVLASSEFAAWVKRQSGDSDGLFTASGNGHHLLATNNRSYGYTYLWAWVEKMDERPAGTTKVEQ